MSIYASVSLISPEGARLDSHVIWIIYTSTFLFSVFPIFCTSHKAHHAAVVGPCSSHEQPRQIKKLFWDCSPWL